MYCYCGQEVDCSSGTFYSIATYNSKGEIIYAVCIHGFVVINKLSEEEKNNV